MKTKSKITKPSLDTIATRYNRTKRTVRSWKREAPPGTLDDDGKLSAWLAGRRHQVFRNTAPLKKSATVNLPITATPTHDEIAGAAAALRRLEGAELQTFGDLQAALKTRDPLTIRNARSSWLAVSSELRRFDLVVEAARRDAKELVPVEEILRVLRFILQGLHLATIWNAEKITSELVAGTDRWTILKKLKSAGVDALTGALAPMFAEGKTAWFSSTLHEFATRQSTSDDEQIRHITALYLECQQAIRANTHEPAEDEPAIARIVHRCLRRLGYDDEPADAATATAENQPAAKDTTP